MEMREAEDRLDRFYRYHNFNIVDYLRPAHLLEGAEPFLDAYGASHPPHYPLSHLQVNYFTFLLPVTLIMAPMMRLMGAKFVRAFATARGKCALDKLRTAQNQCAK